MLAVMELLRGRAVLPGAVLDDALVVADGDLLVWVGAASDATADLRRAATPLDGATLLPGLVDVHCHGGGGAGCVSTGLLFSPSANAASAIFSAAVNFSPCGLEFPGIGARDSAGAGAEAGFGEAFSAPAPSEARWP